MSSHREDELLIIVKVTLKSCDTTEVCCRGDKDSKGQTHVTSGSVNVTLDNRKSSLVTHGTCVQDDIPNEPSMLAAAIDELEVDDKASPLQYRSSCCCDQIHLTFVHL